MATVTGLTAQRMLEIEAMSIVNGGIDLVTGRLKLERHDGGIIDAGDVRGVGLTPGGDTGTALFKKSPNDFDTEWRKLDTSDVATGVFDPSRMAHVHSDASTRAWFTTNPTGGWGGAHTSLAMSPPTDATWTNALELRVNNVPKFAIDKNGTLTAGNIPADRVNSGLLSPARIPHIVSSQSGETPYAIFGVDPSLSYNTSGTALRMSNRSGATTGERFAIYDSSRKILILAQTDSAGDYIAMLAAYTRTTTAAANLVAFTTAGAIGRSTSLRAAKVSIEDAPESWADKVWSLRPRTWFDKGDADLVAEAFGRADDGEDVDWSEVVASPLRRIPGFVAEEVEAAGLEEFLIRDETGALTGLAYDRFSAALLVAMKDERERRIALEATVSTLAEKIEALEARLPEEPMPTDT